MREEGVLHSFVRVRKDAAAPEPVSRGALRRYYEAQCERAAAEGISLIVALPRDEKSWDVDMDVAVLETLRTNLPPPLETFVEIKMYDGAV
eukprot:7385489-Prymnesium_polylepis.1